MKKKQLAVASLITPCGKRRVFVSGDLEKFGIRFGRIILIQDRFGQTDVAVENFPQFKNGHFKFIFYKNIFQVLFRFEDFFISDDFFF